jgi:hypothetical protein
MARGQLSHRNEGSATLGPTRTGIAQQGLVAGCLAAVAFACYYATLLPSLDLGDSASFQTGVGSLTLTPRHAYPLYHGLAGIFVWLYPGEAARAVNLASAVFGAIAIGLAGWFAARLADSLLAGIGAGLFLAFSYTFWSQAITAEVYTLHLTIVGAAGLAILAWADRPTVRRLALFYAIYAVGFGNHLSMILLLPGFTAFLLLYRSRGSADPLRPPMLALAIGIAALGTLQYAWNFRGLFTELEPPATLGEALAKFWFDVTKQDWRETLVNTVSEAGLEHRPAMYWFDLRQQVGIPGVALAAIGFSYVLWRWPRRAILLLLIYASNMAFAWTYNVGDVYIFFLPSHYVVALCAGAGVTAIAALSGRFSNRAIATTVAALLLLYPAWRGYDTFPAVDRSWDRRAEQLLDEFISPATRSHNAIYGVDSNWQVQNAFEYYMRERRPGTPWFSTEELEWLQEGDRVARFEDFVRANAQIGRSLIITERVADKVLEKSGRRMSTVMPHIEAHVVEFRDRIKSVRPGTPYVLSVLRSDREFSLNTTGLTGAWEWLAPHAMPPNLRHFTVIVGRVGERPALVESQDRPYRIRVRLGPFDIDVRMESWLPTDTIRRAGFGHVIVNRTHMLTLERGLSFVALGPNGGLIYESGLFAPIERHIIRPNP